MWCVRDVYVMCTWCDDVKCIYFKVVLIYTVYYTFISWYVICRIIYLFNTHTHPHTHTPTYTHTYTHIHTHTHTHTHWPLNPVVSLISRRVTIHVVSLIHIFSFTSSVSLFPVVSLISRRVTIHVVSLISRRVTYLYIQGLF